MQYFKYTDLTIENKIVTTGLKHSAKLVSSRYPVRLTSYYANLIKKPEDPIWKQCMPDKLELDDHFQCPDPLDEQLLSPVHGLIHRYPNRVVVLVSNRCPVYCRFCMRKRLVGCSDEPMSEEAFKRVCDYIASHTEIHDVILSGGDPLMLDDGSLSKILANLRKIPHVAIIRIGTRVPVTFPERITGELCCLLKKHHPVFVNTHFNHPSEITAHSSYACSLLADAGIPIGNQTVLLKGVNDNIETIKKLMTGLLTLRVKPYYLHQMDLVQGTAHFRTSVRSGLAIVRGLRGHISGLAVPHYVIDLPGGKGKVAVLPDDVKISGNTLRLRTYTGETVTYVDITDHQE